MPDPTQNGAPKPPEIPEGTMYLFVLFNPKTAEYACTFSNLTERAGAALPGGHVTGKRKEEMLRAG